MMVGLLRQPRREPISIQRNGNKNESEPSLSFMREETSNDRLGSLFYVSNELLDR